MKVNFDDLVEQKLVTKKSLPQYANLSLYKYARKVMYDNLWNTDNRLLMARGIITNDNTDEIVVFPFNKSFNYNEKEAPKIESDRLVKVVRKINGFMFGITPLEEDEIIFSCTGSVDSDFSKLAQSKFTNDHQIEKLLTGWTYLFEVTDHRDPHIVNEDPGLWLIGMRNLNTGKLESQEVLDTLAKPINAAPRFLRPEYKVCMFGEIDMSARHEGYMVYDFYTNELLCKMKTPYYLAKKFIMRKSIEKVVAAAKNPQNLFFPAEYRFIAQFISDNVFWWQYVNEQDKGKVFDDLLSDQDNTLRILRLKNK